MTGVLAFNSAASLASNSGARSLSGILILANPSLVISGVNDTDEQAQELSKHARRLSAKINLIPYSTVEGPEWSRPSRARQQRLHAIVREHGVVGTLRREKGHDIAAACGQLRLQMKRAAETAHPANQVEP